MLGLLREYQPLSSRFSVELSESKLKPRSRGWNALPLLSICHSARNGRWHMEGKRLTSSLLENGIKYEEIRILVDRTRIPYRPGAVTRPICRACRAALENDIDGLARLIDRATTHHRWFARALAEPRLIEPEDAQPEWVAPQGYGSYP